MGEKRCGLNFSCQLFKIVGLDKFCQQNFEHNSLLAELKALILFQQTLNRTRNSHWRTGKILLGGLNKICPNENCWSQMHKMILS